ncbi:MAG: RimK/LysX family protein [Paraglaciecola sp.]|uniref:ATP-dependent zinc protease family protein n=1 Tax=Paraglaciecola sp. TaxID=1920173 RepID=UPI0027401B94|nr:RimK/LysX family protein [Paraglaciecola sp.]MDP5030148.1 RimK/LysX family protein [Paraglaciecola sp.]MDP5041158.1 RimK/LysX family protein [Paraglaciecola sp.]MDP5130439.1 RimK/LysX family protein [Paraglaciecola sp.]
MNVLGNKHVVGSLELCDLPELSINDLNVRVDTGATTSSLHVDNIDEFERDGESWVSFDIHPDIHQVSKIVRREVKVADVRKVKSSTATREKRFVITTTIVMAKMKWPIQLTLTDRSEMSYLMLLGREAMQGRLVVDPEFEYLLTKNKTNS